MRVAWSRAIVAGFWFVTAVYCLLSAIPFASEQFLKPGLSPALRTFAEWHPWISFGALLATSAGLAPWLRSGHLAARGLVAAWAIVGVALFVAPPLSLLKSSSIALTLALLSLVPPVWISLIDLTRESSAPAARDHDIADAVSRDFAVCVLAGLIVTMIFAAAALPPTLPFGTPAAALAGLRSLLLHLVVFSGIFAVLCVVRGAARLVSSRDEVEEWMARGVLAAALALFIYSVVLRSLSFAGASATIVAAGFGTALAAAFGPRSTGRRPGLARALSGLVPRWAARSSLTAIAWLVLVSLLIWSVERQAAVTDWNFTIAKSAAFVSWLWHWRRCFTCCRPECARSLNRSRSSPVSFCWDCTWRHRVRRPPSRPRPTPGMRAIRQHAWSVMRSRPRHRLRMTGSSTFFSFTPTSRATRKSSR